MREVSFVNRLKFNFDGSITKRALVIGDADNDNQNELVCANLHGDLAIFKGRNPNKFASATELGMVTACSIGDFTNSDKNVVAAINMEGWLFLFDVKQHDARVESSEMCGFNQCSDTATIYPVSGHNQNQHPDEPNKSRNCSVIELKSFYEQRMPSNCKELLIADLDGDGQNELIIGLTDRVLRTYKWIKIYPEQGKFVGLYKWEFADQIGSVSLNPSGHKNCQDIIVAQPGGTYAKLECFDKQQQASNRVDDTRQAKLASNLEPLPSDDDNVRTEYVTKLTPEYHQLALSQMRNHHVSTEVLGSIKDGKGSSCYSLIVIATLDGTLMLVNKDEILWSLQVDHQLFALAVLESFELSEERHPKLPQSESTCTIVPSPEYHLAPELSESGDHRATTIRETSESHKSQYFVACAWNGKTYIIDEERNYLRFKFDEAVSAFTAGNYFFDGKHSASLVYATFNNQIILYYDVLLENIRPIYLLDEIKNNPDYGGLLENLHKLADKLSSLDDSRNSSCEMESPQTCAKGDSLTSPISNSNTDNNSTLKLHTIINDVLYNITRREAQLLCDEVDHTQDVQRVEWN